MLTPGRWLQIIGVAHGAIGAVLYRDALGAIGRDKVVATVPDHGDRATAFWFMMAAPAMWVGGRLLCSAEESGDLPAQRTAGTVLALTGLTGTAAMPKSGFPALAAAGAAALRRGLAHPD